MTNTTLEKNFIQDSFINKTPTVVILEDMYLIRNEIQQFIKDELGWEVIIAENRSEVVKLCEAHEAEFYILDIKLGNEKDKSQAGMDTAEEIRQIDKNVFVSIFSGVPNLEPHKKMADKIGVNYFEEKGNVVQYGVARIAVEMLRFQKKSLNDILKNCFSKVEEVDQKIEVIRQLEKTYQSESTDHLISDEANDDEKGSNPAFLPIEKDENIQKYEFYKQEDPEWRKEYQDKYVAFADGKWLKDFVADNLKDLLDKLRNSEHSGKSIFYKKVPKNNIVDTQGSDKFIEEEVYELPMSFYDFYPSEDEV
jgi:DNA-binding response OmpR family regulator